MGGNRREDGNEEGDETSEKLEERSLENKRHFVISSVVRLYLWRTTRNLAPSLRGTKQSRVSFFSVIPAKAGIQPLKSHPVRIFHLMFLTQDFCTFGAKSTKSIGERKTRSAFAFQNNAFIWLKQFLSPNPKDITVFFFQTILQLMENKEAKQES
jgi:hypothetical protein